MHVQRVAGWIERQRYEVLVFVERVGHRSNAISDTEAIRPASGVATANVVPYWIIDGADEIDGRGPLKR